MTVTTLGEITLGDALPGIVAALATALADIQAKIEACLQFSVSITPPSLTADLTIAGEIVANLTAALAIGIEPPSIDVQAALMLEAVLAFQLQLEIILQLKEILLAGVHVYKYEGQVGNFGTEMQAEIGAGLPAGSGTDIALALTYIATVAESVTAMQALFKTNP